MLVYLPPTPHLSPVVQPNGVALTFWFLCFRALKLQLRSSFSLFWYKSPGFGPLKSSDWGYGRRRCCSSDLALWEGGRYEASVTGGSGIPQGPPPHPALAVTCVSSSRSGCSSKAPSSSEKLSWSSHLKDQQAHKTWGPILIMSRGLIDASW